ncbi:MAG: nucleotidyltransferase domain-containing protein [Desulfohalobiaceae bacterium]
MAKILPEIENIIHNYLLQVKESKQISRAYLYGSFARGAAGKWSDIDLAIISPDFSEDLFEERISLMKQALKVDDRIEPSPFRPEDFNPENPLVHEISSYGIEINLE